MINTHSPQVLNDDNLMNGKVDVTLNNNVGDDVTGIHRISDTKTVVHHEVAKEPTSNKDEQLDHLLQHIYDNFVKKAKQPGKLCIHSLS